MRIAALEQHSEDTEKLIAESRCDRLKHLEEVYKANRRAAALEAKYAHAKHRATGLERTSPFPLAITRIWWHY
jgi:hypothetical protein